MMSGKMYKPRNKNDFGNSILFCFHSLWLWAASRVIIVAVI